MPKRYLTIICFIFFAGFIFLCCTEENRKSDVFGSSDHADLISLFREFREFQQPSLSDGAPDYSAASMEKQYLELKTYQNRLAAIDSNGWTVSEQIDYHLVRAEMNGLEFRHRVLKPWSLDPGFYNDVISRTGRVRDLPLDENAAATLRTKLKSVPSIVAQAKVNLNNLSDVAGDLGTLAVLSLGDTRASFESLSRRLSEHHPELTAGMEIAYEQAAFRTVRALSDVYMHSRDWSLEDATKFCIENAPHGELLEGSHHLWYELDTTLRGVGHHMIMIVGKIQFMKLFRDRAQQLGDGFNLRQFMDEFLAAGMIPISLIRWEMTGLDDEIKKLWE